MTTSLPRLFAHLTFCCALAAAAPALAQNVQTPDSTGDEEEISSPLAQVSLEANTVTIVLNDEHRDGVDWSAIVSDFHSVQLKKADNPVWADKKFKLSVGTVSNEDYAVLLEALDTVGRMSQKPHPAFNINLNEKQEEILNDEVSLTLQMSRPRGGEWSLSIEPQLSVAKEILKAQTKLALSGNTTIVIGGIFKEEEITKTHKFPLLGDLPLLGLVFRSRGHLMQKTETVIFLTVHEQEVLQEKADEAN